MADAKQSGPGTGNGAVGPEIERLVASAEDALTDDMVTRLGATVSDGLDLLDRINRSGIGDALPVLSSMVQSGDLQRIAGLARLIASAEDSLSDDIVGRLSATASSGLDLLDRLNRSGIGDALPVISEMSKNGDLKRVSDLARLIASAEDSLSDDIVGRLSATAVGALDLLDRVNHSGIVRALPAITQLVENGDLERLVGLARLIAAMEDSLSDDIVDRLAMVVTGLAAVVDKLSRTPGFLRLIDVLARDEVQAALLDMVEAVSAAKAEAVRLPPSRGGMGGLMRLARDPGTQDALRFLALANSRLQQRTTAER